MKHELLLSESFLLGAQLAQALEPACPTSYSMSRGPRTAELKAAPLLEAAAKLCARRTLQFNAFSGLLSFSFCQNSAGLHFPFKTSENPNGIYKNLLVKFVGLIVTAQTPFHAFPVS